MYTTLHINKVSLRLALHRDTVHLFPILTLYLQCPTCFYIHLVLVYFINAED